MNSPPGPEWFEDDSIWRELYPFMFSETAFAAASQQIDRVVQLTGVRAGSALDLCCGPGRHTVELAKRGFSVTAVDRTAFLLDKARARAADANVFPEFVLEDMRRFSRPASFDLIVNLFTSFGFFDDKADDLQVLRLVRENLKPGGMFLVEMVSKEWLAKSFQPTVSTKLANGDLLIQRHEVIDDWTRIKNEWTLIQSGRIRTIEFRHRLYSGQEIKDLLITSGLSDAQVYGDLDGRPYGLEVKRLVAVARK
jgi:SAM-dependent methyltransferase